MLHRTFGRRGIGEPAAALQPAPTYLHHDDGSRLIPASFWDGPQGDELRRLGFHPDDPSNLVLTPDRARAKEDAATAQMNALVAKVNAHIPGVTVIPWAMIPWSVWRGLNAELLIKSDFLPSSPWNNMLLPADAASSEFLGLPEHPRVEIPGVDENVTEMIDQLRDEKREVVEATKAGLMRGDWSALERFEAHRQEQFQKLFALARHIGNLVFGEHACARHDELFGIGLSEVTG